MQKYFDMEDLREAVQLAMAERGVGQAELARQSGLSQGHLSKVLRTMKMGRRTRDRLQKWLDHADHADFQHAVGPDDLLQIGAILKRHCDELAQLSRRMRAGATPPAERSR
jgi:transcriptional regulator with XRE-family HTH domain